MIASASLSRVDGGLGARRVLALPPAVVGCSSAGIVATPTLVTSIADLVTTFGYGPLVERVGWLLDKVGGPIVACRATTATAGAASSVTATSGNTSTAVMTVSGAAADIYSVTVKVTRAGADLAATTAAVRVSLDAGVTYLPEVAVPVNGEVTIPYTGITADFADGTFVVGDTFTFTTSAPAFDASGIGAAFDALRTTPYGHEYVHIAGASVAATFDRVVTELDENEAAGIYRWAFLEARLPNSGESVATWLGVLAGTSPGFSGKTDTRIAVAAGGAKLTSPVTGVKRTTSVGALISARCALIAESQPPRRGISEHPGRVETGPVDGLLYGTGDLVHDIRTNPSLDTNHFCGIQSIVGRSDGYYRTARTRAADGSGYTETQRTRLIIQAQRVALAELTTLLNSDPDTVDGTGALSPDDADAIDERVTGAMRRELVTTRLAQNAAARINRTDDVLATGRVRASVTAKPPAYINELTATVGFSRE